MSDGMRREFAYLSSHATNRYFIPNWGIPLKFICYYPVLSSLSIYSACGGTLSVLATVENSSPSVVVLVKYPSLECDRTVFYKLFLSRCLGDAHPVSV